MSKVHYSFHTWSGAVLGIALYLLCFSGTVAVYKEELMLWSNQSETVPQKKASLDELKDAMSKELPAKDALRRFTFPSAAYGVFELRAQSGARVAANEEGSIQPNRSVALADFFVNLHTRIFLGHEGRWIVGLAGFGFIASLLTGLFVHKRLRVNPFKLHAELRPNLVNWHKFVGLWGFPFYAMLGLTGIWLGLYLLIIPASGYFDARMESEKKPIATPVVDLEKPASTKSLDVLVAHTQKLLPGFEPAFVDWIPAKKSTPATIEVRGNLPGSLIQRHRVGIAYSAPDGGILSVHAPGYLPGSQRVHDAMMPLHVGDWFGGWVKLGYFLGGLSASALCLTGVFAWAERRAKQSGWVGGAAKWPWHFSIATTIPGSLGIVAMPVAAKFGVIQIERLFLISWACMCVAYLLAAAMKSGFNFKIQSGKREAFPFVHFAYGIHALVVIGSGYAQYLAAREKKEMVLQGSATWIILCGCLLLVASLVRQFYPKVAVGFQLVSAASLVFLAFDSRLALALIGSLLLLVVVTQLGQFRNLGTAIQSDRLNPQDLSR